jgi:glycosyltransferase involved in cell wall biosynthesis
LVLVGPAAQSYRNMLERLAREVGVAQRVHFLGSIPHREIWSLAVGAMIGVSLVADQSDLNWSHSAGAINKRFEYMSVGLPQIANFGKGMVDIIERRSCGVLVNPKSSEEFGRAVAGLLRNEDYRQRMAANARSAHLDEFNYERQFERVREMIFKWCEEGIAG